MELKYCEKCKKDTPHSNLGLTLFCYENKKPIKMKRLRCIFCGSQFDTVTIKMM